MDQHSFCLHAVHMSTNHTHNDKKTTNIYPQRHTHDCTDDDTTIQTQVAQVITGINKQKRRIVSKSCRSGLELAFRLTLTLASLDSHVDTCTLETRQPGPSSSRKQGRDKGKDWSFKFLVQICAFVSKHGALYLKASQTFFVNKLKKIKK